MGDRRKLDERGPKLPQTELVAIVEGLCQALYSGMVVLPAHVTLYRQPILDAMDNDFTTIDQAIINLRNSAKKRLREARKGGMLAKWALGMAHGYQANLYVLTLYEQILRAYYKETAHVTNTLSTRFGWKDCKQRGKESSLSREAGFIYI